MDHLNQIADYRLRIKPLSCSQGVAAARNAGVDEAKGLWIAFLDDDDQWLPGKLDTQLGTAQQSTCQDPVISCRLIKRSETGDVVLPRRLPTPDEPISDYLLRRSRLFGGEGLVQTSTILTSKTLMQQVPFREGVRRHEDLEWLLRASTRDGTVVQFVLSAEPLVIWYKEQQRETVGTSKDRRFSLSWIRENRQLVTPRAYASFLLTCLSANAVRQGDRSAFWSLLNDAFRHGSPSALDLFVFIGIWLIPRRARERISDMIGGRRSSIHS